MSNPIQSNGTATTVFQAHFGAPPGSQDAKAECEKWQRLCDELLAERTRLRAELEKIRLDAFCREPIPNLTMEEVYARVDHGTSLDQLIAGFKKELEESQ
jgi:hypothetical protein